MNRYKMMYIVEKSIIKYCIKCIFKGFVLYSIGTYINPAFNVLNDFITNTNVTNV